MSFVPGLVEYIVIPERGRGAFADAVKQLHDAPIDDFKARLFGPSYFGVVVDSLVTQTRGVAHAVKR